MSLEIGTIITIREDIPLISALTGEVVALVKKGDTAKVIRKVRKGELVKNIKE